LRLEFDEFDYGFTYRRIREGMSESDPMWTVGRVCLWPNALFPGDHFEWRVPIDDEHTLSVTWAFTRVPQEREPYVQQSIPAWHGPVKDPETGRWISSHVMNQDFLMWCGQGAVAERSKEYLATSDRGVVLIRKLDKVRISTRVEFLCGLRAARRARADFDSLSAIAHTLSAPLDETPALVGSQIEALKTTEKDRRRLEEELGASHGRELYDGASPDSLGIRRATKRLPSGALDTLRPVAQSFCARPMAVFVGAVDQPPAILFATSQDSGLDAGKLLKAALNAAGGRGGGGPRLAQGSAPSIAALEQAVTALSASRPD
jgi:hypothetical protein